MVKLVSQLNKVARSKPFQYLVYAAAVLQICKIAADRSVYCGGMFLLTAAIGCQFTKNKALCLVAGLVVTNFVVGCSKIVEGLTQADCEQDGLNLNAAGTECEGFVEGMDHCQPGEEWDPNGGPNGQGACVSAAAPLPGGD